MARSASAAARAARTASRRPPCAGPSGASDGSHTARRRSTQPRGADHARTARLRAPPSSRPPSSDCVVPVDVASLVVFRIAFGAIMFTEIWQNFTNGWIRVLLHRADLPFHLLPVRLGAPLARRLDVPPLLDPRRPGGLHRRRRDVPRHDGAVLPRHQLRLPAGPDDVPQPHVPRLRHQLPDDLRPVPPSLLGRCLGLARASGRTSCQPGRSGCCGSRSPSRTPTAGSPS